MDIDELLLDEFVAEANEHLETIEDDFLALERQKEAPDPDLVDKVFRAIHSVKGGAAFVGLGRIKELAHAMESLLSKMRAGDLLPSSQHIDTLLQGVDLLNKMVAAPLQSEQVDIATILAALKAQLAGEDAPPRAPEPQRPLRQREPLSAPQQEAAPSQTTEPPPAAADAEGAPHSPEQAPAATAPDSAPDSASESAPEQQLAIVAELPEDSLLDLETLVAATQAPLETLLQEHGALYYLRIDLDQPQAPPLDAVQKTLEQSGEVLDAALTLPPNDADLPLPPQGLAAEVLLASNRTCEEITAPLQGGHCVLLRRLEEVPPQHLPAPESTPHADQPLESLPAPEALAPEPANMPAETPPAPAKSPPAAAGQDAARSPERGGTVRISVGLLDKLMALAGELVLVRNQQLLTVERSDSLARDTVQRLDMVTSELQETIMQTRMQPLGNIFNKMPRIVRDLSNTLAKEIELEIQGNEVELDKTILEALNDPLVHIIRNCCDHGIEPPEVRERADKSPVGTISMRAYHEGGQINIEVSDDGQGIDPAQVRRKALERGLRNELELAQMSDREILSLIMLPGFSTAEEISDVSGRGVGMDVVRHAIESLGGSMDLDSWPGEGTTLQLRLPLTLAIIPCIIAMVGGQRFAIPQVNLEELVCLYDEDVFTRIEVAGNQEVYRLRKKLLPMVRLVEVLSRPEPFSRDTRADIAEKYHLHNQRCLQDLEQQPPAQPEDIPAAPLPEGDNGFTLLCPPDLEGPPPESLSFAVVKVGAERFGLIVDKVLGTEEIVVKPMHPCLKNLRCYSGATVMGDGSVAMILDIEGIARHAGVFLEQPGDEVFSKKGMGVSDADTQSILLFRNGPNEQFALALPLIRRIEKISAGQIETVGAKEFITIDDQSTLVLRLDKLLNVSPCAEKDELFLILPKHIKRPFGILMSHILDIEEAAIHLNTESYMEEGLLGTDIIRGHLTLFPDIYRLIELAEPGWFSDRRQAFPPPEDLRRVLIVEDSSFLRHMLKRYLEADGYEVQDTENGQHALDVLDEQDFDLVVSDIEMPVMDGLEFIRNLRHHERHKDLPALALTSLDTEEDKRRALVAGFNRYQVKLDRERFLADCTKLLTSARS